MIPSSTWNLCNIVFFLGRTSRCRSANIFMRKGSVWEWIIQKKLKRRRIEIKIVSIPPGNCSLILILSKQIRQQMSSHFFFFSSSLKRINTSYWYDLKQTKSFALRTLSKTPLVPTDLVPEISFPPSPRSIFWRK